MAVRLDLRPPDQDAGARVLSRVADAVIVDGGLTKLGPAIVWAGSGRVPAGCRMAMCSATSSWWCWGAGSILFLSTFWLPYRGVRGRDHKAGPQGDVGAGEGRS